MAKLILANKYLKSKKRRRCMGCLSILRRNPCPFCGTYNPYPIRREVRND